MLVLDEEAHAKRDELARMAAALEETLRRPTPHATAALAVKALRSAMIPVAAEALYRGRPEPESVGESPLRPGSWVRFEEAAAALEREAVQGVTEQVNQSGKDSSAAVLDGPAGDAADGEAAAAGSAAQADGRASAPVPPLDAAPGSTGDGFNDPDLAPLGRTRRTAAGRVWQGATETSVAALSRVSLIVAAKIGQARTAAAGGDKAGAAGTAGVVGGVGTGADSRASVDERRGVTSGKVLGEEPGGGSPFRGGACAAEPACQPPVLQGVGAQSKTLVLAGPGPAQEDSLRGMRPKSLPTSLAPSSAHEDSLRVVTARLLLDNVRLWRGFADLGVARGRVASLGPLRPTVRQGWALFASTGAPQRPVSLPQLPAEAAGPAQDWLQSSSALIQQAYTGMPWRHTPEGRNLAARLGQGVGRLRLSTVLGRPATGGSPSPSSPARDRHPSSPTRTPAGAAPGTHDALPPTEADRANPAVARAAAGAWEAAAGDSRGECRMEQGEQSRASFKQSPGDGAAGDSRGGAQASAGGAQPGPRGLAAASSIAAGSTGALGAQSGPGRVSDADAEPGGYDQWAAAAGGAGAPAGSPGGPSQLSDGPGSAGAALKTEQSPGQAQHWWWNWADGAGGRGRREGQDSPGSVQAIAVALVDSLKGMRATADRSAEAGPASHVAALFGSDGKEDAGGPERSTRSLKLAHDAGELVAWAEGAVEGVAEAHRYAEALEAAEAESRARAAEITSVMQRLQGELARLEEERLNADARAAADAHVKRMLASQIATLRAQCSA
mmetsp:Transcript_19927/g.41770  ORF Transcript_19927/g.41770 Transcript_19927/m.41770 type:complete len:783 (-) Transcript_19927:59-2407(-)